MINPHPIRRLTTGVLPLLVLIAGAAVGHAQQVGLANSYRLVSTDAPSEIRVDTGLIHSAVPLVNSDTNAGTKSGSTSTATFTVSSYYGNMSFSGNGSVTNSAAQGAFVWIDTPMGGAPYSKYQDIFHVDSSTLAAGTPVSIGFKETFVANATVDDPLGPNDGFGSPWIQDLVYLSDNQGPGQWNLTLNGTGSAEYVMNTKIGDTLSVRGELHGYDFANANTLQVPTVTSSFYFSASGPLYVTSVSDGVNLWAESGATYQQPASSVPDSGSTLALLAIACAPLLWLGARRQAPRRVPVRTTG